RNGQARAEEGVVARQYRGSRVTRLKLVEQSEQSAQERVVDRVRAAGAKDHHRDFTIPLDLHERSIAPRATSRLPILSLVAKRDDRIEASGPHRRAQPEQTAHRD